MLSMRGDKKLLNNFKKLRVGILSRLASSMQETANVWHEETRTRLLYPFQSVPSYLWESKLKLPQKQDFPPGTPAFFATSSQSIQGGLWESQVQQYPRGPHPLANKLTTSVTNNEGEVSVGLGYDEQTEASESGRKIRFVLFGTTKMQPRNFLGKALERIENSVVQWVGNDMEKAIENVGLE